VDSSSSPWLAPGVGLIGVLLGGFIAVVTTREQWRRESRRQAYAELMTTAYEVRWALGAEYGHLEDQRQSINRAVAQFLATLDAANLLAAYRVQHVLTDWRAATQALLHSEDSRASITEERWIAYQERFRVAAKAELHIRGPQGYGRLTAGLLAGAFFFLSVGGSHQYLSQGIDTIERTVGSASFWIGLTLLIFSAIMAYRARLSRLTPTLWIIVADVYLVVSSGGGDFYRPNSAAWHFAGVGAILFILGGRF
jgi:hypothetical protein